MLTPAQARLHELLDAYFAALAAGDPGRLPLAADARFTENGQQLAIGAGLWATMTAASDSRAVTVADPAAGQVAGWGMVTEGGDAEALLGVRLRMAGKAIREIETLVVRRPPFGRTTFPESLYKASPVLPDILDPAERGSREELVAAANRYLDGVSRDDADLVLSADDGVRIENGVPTVLNADGAGLEDIRDRRIAAADPERGLVLVCCFFDHPGQRRDAGFTSPLASPTSVMIWELSKVAGGRIRRIEAIGAAFPYGMRAGW